MGKLELSTNSKKALTVHLGQAAGREVAELLQRFAERVERLERSKIDIMPVVAEAKTAARRADRSRKTAR